jgi:hypothetical protein
MIVKYRHHIIIEQKDGWCVIYTPGGRRLEWETGSIAEAQRVVDEQWRTTEVTDERNPIAD